MTHAMREDILRIKKDARPATHHFLFTESSTCILRDTLILFSTSSWQKVESNMQLSTSLRFLAVFSTVMASHALQLPPLNNNKMLPEVFAKGCATASLCTSLIMSTTVLPVTAAAATPPPTPTTTSSKIDNTALKVDLDTPYLLDLVKTKQARSQTIDRIQYLEDSIKNLFGPAVKIELPTDYRGLVKKAFSGRATILVGTNGQQQQQQRIDLQVVQSDFGSLTVQIKSPLLPKLPLVGLPGTPAVVESAAVIVEDAVTPTVVNVWQKLSKPREPPFWTKPIGEVNLPNLGYYKQITPLDVVGAGSLGLGGIYAASYAYYKEEQRREEDAAANRKAAAAAKRKAVPSIKKKVASERKTVATEPVEEDIESSATMKEEAQPEIQMVPPMAAAGQTAVAVVDPVVNLPISSEPQLKRASKDTSSESTINTTTKLPADRKSIGGRIKDFLLGRFRKT